MNLWRVLKFALIGFAFQVLIHICAGFASQGFRNTLRYIYEPWLNLGEYLFPSGPGGHAMPGGALLGLLFGVIVYSVVIGVVIYPFKSAFSDTAKDR